MPIAAPRLKIAEYRETRRQKRLKRERLLNSISLSLTSMVDMFAILVIFLLANSASVSQWIELAQGLSLPKATHTDELKKGRVLQLSRTALFWEGEHLGTLEELLDSKELHPKLKLVFQSAHETTKELGILADESLDFRWVRKSIQLARENGFENVQLAVQPQS